MAAVVQRGGEQDVATCTCDVFATNGYTIECGNLCTVRDTDNLRGSVEFLDFP